MSRTWRRLGAGLVALTSAAVTGAIPGHASTPPSVEVSVDTPLDIAGTASSNSTPDCASPCSLRKAIQFANGQPIGVTTKIRLPAGDYVLTLPKDDQDTAAAGDLQVNRMTEIIGAGAATTIIEQAKSITDRVITVTDALRMSGVTVRGGRATEDGGGGIFVSYGQLELADSVVRGNSALSDGSGLGGGILLQGFNRHGSTIRNVTVAENTGATYGAGIAANGGGGLAILASTISGNTCGQGCLGGGVYALGPVSMTNTTVDGNSADQGGGLYSDGGQVIVTSSTFSDNKLSRVVSNARTPALRPHDALTKGASIFASAPSGSTAVKLRNSIIAGNPLNECGQPLDSSPTQPPLVSAGYNIEDGLSCALTAAGDKPATDAKLGPLQDNGGPTKTRAIGPGSPALDAVSPESCPAPARDQRNTLRANAGGRTGTACDIGAYEYQAPAPVVPSPSPTSVVQDVIIYVLVTPGLPQAGRPVTAALQGQTLPLLAIVGLLLASLVAALAYHMALRYRRGDT